jgi:DNA polymerase III delta prime subunit
MVNLSTDQRTPPQSLSALRRLVRQRRIPSAMIFHGERGIGKGATARQVGTALLCTLSVDKRGDEEILGCGNCHGCSVIAAGNHPDLHYLDLADSESWTTASFRSFLSSLSLKPFSGGSRVIIFDNAEAMSSIGECSPKIARRAETGESLYSSQRVTSKTTSDYTLSMSAFLFCAAIGKSGSLSGPRELI